MQKLLAVMFFALLCTAPVKAQVTQIPDFIQVADVVWSPAGNLLAVSAGNTLSVYDIQSDSMTRMWSTELTTNNSFSTLTFDPSGKWLASGIGDGSLEAGMVYVWDSGTGEQLAKFKGNQVGVHALAFSPASDQLAIGGGDSWASYDTIVRIWQTDRWQDTQTKLYGHGAISSIAYSADDHWLAYTGDSDIGPVYIVDRTTGLPALAIYERATDLQFEKDSSRLWLLSRESSVVFRESWIIQKKPGAYATREGHLPVEGAWGRPAGVRILSHLRGDWIVGGSDGSLQINGGNLNAFHIDDGYIATAARLNEDETQLAVTSQLIVPYGSTTPVTDKVAIWTLATGEYRTLDLGAK